MALTPSTMLELGKRAPHFDLEDVVSGDRVDLKSFEGRGPLLVMFVCNHCPFVIHVREEIARIAEEYAGQGVSFVAISSNDVERYPDDGPGPLADMARSLGWEFPVLLDSTQEVARAYRAACTPDFYLFDRGMSLVYRGRMDASRPASDVPVDGVDLRNALDAVLAGRPCAQDQQPSVGCNIKWAPGNEPDYFG